MLATITSTAASNTHFKNKDVRFFKLVMDLLQVV